MRAIDLIPADAGLSGRSSPPDVQVGVYAVIGVLAAAVVLSVMYVLAGNDIAQRRAQLSTLRTEVAQTQARIGQLDQYVRFQRLAEQRAQTVRQLASARFDWAGAFSQLSRVVPANTTLQSLNGSTGSGSTPTPTPSAPTGPSFQLAGCTGSQVDVARLMSRLRLVDGVSSVSLISSQKNSGPPPAGAPSASAASAPCPPRGPQFNLTIAFANAGTGTATTGTGVAG